MEVAPAEALAGLAYAGHTILVALAARDQVLGYVGNLAAAIVWFVGAAHDHLGEVLFATATVPG